MFEIYDPKAVKKNQSLRGNGKPVKKATEVEQSRRWSERNKSPIAAYNLSVGENGVFSDGLRSF